MTGTAPIRPSWWFYILAIVLFLGGGSYFVYGLWHGISHITDSLVQVVVPGEVQLPLKSGVDYTVFIETESVFNGKIYSVDGPINGLACQATTPGEPEKIPMKTSSMSTTYHVRGRSGRSVLEFRVSRDGTYIFSCGYSAGREGSQVVMAVGSGVGEGILKTVFVSLASFFGGIGSALVIYIGTFILRQRAKARERTGSHSLA